MDLLVELVIDIFGELLIDGSVDATTNSKLPKPVRIFLLILINAFFLSIFGGFIYLATLVNTVVERVFVIGIALLMLAFLIKVWRKFSAAKQ